jgi:hypothetical protein
MSLDVECIKPSIQFTKSNFTIGAWGLFSIDSSYDEVDIYVGYKVGKWNFMFYDFYMYPQGSENKSIFDYSKEAGLHMLDFTASYTVSKEFPLTIMGAAMWAAFESNYSYMPTAASEIKNNKMPIGELDALSTYLEFSYPSKIGKTNVSYILGMAPGGSRHSRWFDESGRKHYSDGLLYITNLGLSASHIIKVSDTFSLPISATLTFNPHQEVMFLQFNVSLSN